MTVWYMKIAYKSVKILRRVIDLIVSTLFGFVYGKSQDLPPITNLLLLEPASALAARIRSGKLKSLDLVECYIDRINDVQPYLNVVVHECFQDALKEATRVDNFIASREKSEKEIEQETPFLGVPFTTKDAIAIKGVLMTGGLYARKDAEVEKRDADTVGLLRKAGGIPLAVTNVSELCMWWESANVLYGRTNNPYNTNCIVGGSSGGEGCIVGAAASVVSIGSDVGGSIRMPAFFNGVFGHKPSTGIVSNAGEIPEAEGEICNFLCTGPICRYATDLSPMLKVLAGKNVDKLKLDTKVNFKNLKVYYMEDDGGSLFLTPVHPEMKLAIRKAVAHFENTYGIKVQRVNIKNMRQSINIWLTRMSASHHTFASEMMQRKGEVNPYSELFKWFFSLSSHTFPAISLALAEKVIRNTSENGHAPRFYNMGVDMLREFTSLLGDDGIFLYPPHPEPAPYHNEPLFKPFNFAYTAIFNILGLPVTVCPMGLSSAGLPVGVQVVSGLNNDHLTLATAVELEKAFGGWVTPSATP